MDEMMAVYAVETINKIRKSVQTAIVGKKRVVDLLIAALLCEGHVLIEDVPGVGKTSFIASLAMATQNSFKRIQFTPDVMPSDITGFSMPDIKTGEFKFRPGMVMSNILLADEINRATAKTQSALLEAMEERQVSVDGITYRLPRPFMVLATQNPNENVGTYQLPESQLDRFLMKISIGYPDKNEEITILNKYMNGDPRKTVPQVADQKTIIQLQEYTKSIFLSDSMKEYIVDIINATRESEDTAFGVSPRGSLALLRVAQASAVMNGRNYVTANDVQNFAVEVLSHRLVLTGEAISNGITAENVIKKCVEGIRVPVGAKA